MSLKQQFGSIVKTLKYGYTLFSTIGPWTAGLNDKASPAMASTAEVNNDSGDRLSGFVKVKTQSRGQY